ncbi:MAG TPA: type II 3-dehydroquinate dehydratase [Kiloniellaceae bacterium]|nr:type II 3-dehydroquinate dehydratase [Kiloniellaceae bacterium]
MAAKILLLNGPNLNMLGVREPAIYAKATLPEIEAACAARAAELGLELVAVQTNSEGELVNRIQAAQGDCDGIIINPGAYSHTSVAILDALLAVGLPTIEVHISNIHKREAFRHRSYVSRAADGVLCGFGPGGYIMALDAMQRLLAERSEP